MYRRTTIEIHKDLKEKKVSATETIQACFDRIGKVDPKVKAFLRTYDERAREKAKEIDEKVAQGKPVGKLAGVPVAIKDNINIKGELTTCASKILENYRSVYNATIIDLLEKEDAIIVGKTNMDEFAMGSTTENSAYFNSLNPWDLGCNPGGSSGGSASAVSAGLVPCAIGSDTGGSIRQPAAFTGTVGYKPTYGRLSRYGLVAFASSLDQMGPFTASVEEAAHVLETVLHHCPKDSTSHKRGHEPFLSEIDKSIQGKKVGVPWDFLDNHDEEMRQSFEKTLEHFKALGVEVVPVKLDMASHAIPVYYILSTAEASTNLARFDGVQYSKRSEKAQTLDEIYDFSRREGFGSEVKKRIMLGTFVLSSGYQDAYYNNARKIRTLLMREFKKAFSEVDVIAIPTTPHTSFPFNWILDDAQMHMQDVYTVLANLAGLPAISIPSDVHSNGKPIGFQLLGPQLEDARVLRFAHQLEKSIAFPHRIAPDFQKAAP